MKKITILFALVLSFYNIALADNYSLNVDGKDVDIEVGKKQSITLESGKVIDVTLNKKSIFNYKAEGFSFEHPNRITPSTTALNDGVEQTIMTSPIGTLIIVQEYSTLDPSTLIDTMIKVLTKEEVNYGYKLTEEASSRTTSDGIVLKGKKALSVLKNKEKNREVLAYAGDDSGLLFITQYESEDINEKEEIIDLFWKSLKIKKVK